MAAPSCDTSNPNFKHNDARKRNHAHLYTVWANMINRCKYPSVQSFPRYGGRGIRVCERWRVYANFRADMLPTFRPGLTLNRKNNDGDYCPDNCVWSTPVEQARNTPRNRYLEFEGERLTLVEWNQRLGGSRQAVDRRLALGWTVREALTTPIRRLTRRT
jgi:hypothetical protein